jgi:hypothetical protein
VFRKLNLERLSEIRKMRVCTGNWKLKEEEEVPEGWYGKRSGSSHMNVKSDLDRFGYCWNWESIRDIYKNG